jgi:hypothetical protein
MQVGAGLAAVHKKLVHRDIPVAEIVSALVPRVSLPREEASTFPGSFSGASKNRLIASNRLQSRIAGAWFPEGFGRKWTAPASMTWTHIGTYH